jgi:hypothetical protein
MKRMMLVGLTVLALAFAAAGAARADVPSLPPGSGWCGEAGTCETSMSYVECSDGSIWAIDQSWDADGFGDAMCNGDFALLADSPGYTTLGDAPSSGVDVGLGADSKMAPDPTQYGTEVRCPDGSIWAVPKGDDFVCPAA